MIGTLRNSTVKSECTNMVRTSEHDEISLNVKLYRNTVPDGSKRSRKRSSRFKDYPTLDLHGTNHKRAPLRVINHLVVNHGSYPVRIVTGRSDQMIKIVKDVTERLGCECVMENCFNSGSYIVKGRAA